ncbi:MAG: sugar phosphate isomerase/epimerase [Verrucomicrobia bacterium]|nr:sugar phosphate isomerase/epimerase [Verrucomicrobiota bacterium]
MKSAVTISLVAEAKGGPFVYWDDLAAGFASAAKHGFDAVEIFLPSANAVPLSTVQGLMKKHSLKLAAAGTGAGWVKHKLRLTDSDPAVRERARNFINGLINFAGILGAPVIVGSMQGRWGDGVSREQALDWLAEQLKALGERASGHGQSLLYEPLNRYETNLITRAAEAATFIKERGIKNVKVLCDLFHMNIEETDIAGALRQVGPLLGHVHWADSNRMAVGFGHTHAASIVAALREIDYAGYLSAEVFPLPDSDTAARQSIASFRKFVQNSDS